ncbi:hypothetical protein NDU88_010676 [Pleurodeles waltl]|uniref:Uncharacterized protein n=1 Tax=Pleurodeles waltl TaxID=8319 RepID=A0AAV7PZ36_PLEWA|nr:hypothetical protein NDU88_010676 [Pleurodeles waltl]
MTSTLSASDKKKIMKTCVTEHVLCEWCRLPGHSEFITSAQRYVQDKPGRPVGLVVPCSCKAAGFYVLCREGHTVVSTVPGFWAAIHTESRALPRKTT